jgi:4-diphosphocytidyl-2-C-methyl-D-erythritol kinase
VLAPAKLNLYLEVLERRPDGFHGVETLIVPIPWYDRLRLSLSGRPALRLDYHWRTPRSITQAAPPDERNLVLRAVRILADEAGLPPYGKFELWKRIPAGAGLGGGSSDAAAALWLANQAWGTAVPLARLSELAAQIGSDVPFFLERQAAVCRGRGELIEKIDGLPSLPLVVVVPPEGVRTADVFQRFSESGELGSVEASARRLERLIGLLRRGAIGRACLQMTNRLQFSAGQISSWIEELQRVFRHCGCLGHMMTGSGSGYFGVMRTARQARIVGRQLASMRLGTVWAGATCC